MKVRGILTMSTGVVEVSKGDDHKEVGRGRKGKFRAARFSVGSRRVATMQVRCRTPTIRYNYENWKSLLCLLLHIDDYNSAFFSHIFSHILLISLL